MTTIILTDWPQSPDIIVGEKDHRHLTRAALTDITYHADEVDFLLYELDRAKIVEDGALPSDVVRLNSIVRYRSDGAGERTVKLVLPDDYLRDNAFRLSATSMHGAALLGLRKGQVQSWLRPDGDADRVEVINVANSFHRQRDQHSTSR